jgi:hypothetical protein
LFWPRKEVTLPSRRDTYSTSLEVKVTLLGWQMGIGCGWVRVVCKHDPYPTQLIPTLETPIAGRGRGRVAQTWC